jgi:hypothetical protein
VSLRRTAEGVNGRVTAGAHGWEPHRVSTPEILPRVALRPRWGAPSSPWRPALLGHNTVWCRGGLGVWNEREGRPDPAVLAAVRALRPGAIRLPGGTRAMRWRFDETLGPRAVRRPQCDPFRGVWDDTGYGLHEALDFADSVGAPVSLVAPWVDGTPERTAAMVAYALGDPSDARRLGVDVHGRDWGRAGDWARSRVRSGREAPWDVRWLEVGIEPYLGLPAGPDDACDRPGRFRQCEQWIDGRAVPTTAARYAEGLRRTADLVRPIAPSLKMGAAAAGGLFDDEDPRTEVGAADREAGDPLPWNPTLVRDAGDAFDFWCAHTYVVEPTDARSRLGARTGQTLDALRALDGRACAVTEHGFFLGADTLRNAMASIDVVLACAARDALFAARHLLIEDDPDGPFATCAALLGPTRRLTPAYRATRMAVEALAGDRIACEGALVTIERDRLGAVFTVLAGADVTLALPPGRWRGELRVLGDRDLDAREPSLDVRAVECEGALGATIPHPAVVSVTLHRA